MSQKERELCALYSLATQCGVEVAYESTLGGSRTASPEAIVAILRALGVPLHSSFSNLASLQKEFQGRSTGPRCEPVQVCWTPNAPRIRIHNAAVISGKRISLVARGDDGQQREITAEVIHSGDGRSEGYLECAPLPAGYYDISIQSGKRALSTFLIVAPRHVYSSPSMKKGSRSLGLLSPIYSLHSKQSMGIGDFSDFGRFLSWATEMGCSFAGTLPLFPCFYERPCFEPSPYSPVSRLFWNEIFIDPRAAEEWNSPRTVKIQRSVSFKKNLALLKREQLVDYRRTYRLKRRVLNEMSKGFFENAGNVSPGFVQFLEEEPLVEDYARFRAAAEKLNAPWTEWPERMRRGTLRPGEYHMDDVWFHLYSQWLCSRQIGALSENEAAALLYLDFPLGLHPASYDIWRYPSSFAQDAFAGCPPDKGHPEGQDWGIIPLHPSGMRKERYVYLRRCLGKQMRYAGMLRLDHVMNLYRLYWVPKGLGPKEGAYVRYPCEELFAILSLESNRHKCVLIGEALGTVPPEIMERLSQHKILSMYIQQRSLVADSEAPMREPAESSVAYFGSHDQPTFKGYWECDDIRDKHRLGRTTQAEVKKKIAERKSLLKALLTFLQRRALLPRGELQLSAVMRATFRLLSRSSARAALMNVEDLWLEAKPQNTPTTQEERPNWRRKHKLSLERMLRSNRNIPITVRAVRREAVIFSKCSRNDSKPADRTSMWAPDARRIA